MRDAILHGLVPQYAGTSFTITPQIKFGRGRGHVLPRGGQLMVGGAVVGQWGHGNGRQTGNQNVQQKKKKNKKVNKQLMYFIFKD